MSLLSKNVIPGKKGETFATNAMKENDLTQIKNSLLELEGVNDVVLNTTIFPREFTVFTNKIISLADIEHKVKSVGFHAIPKETFKL
jgi:hypothetical protein